MLLDTMTEKKKKGRGRPKGRKNTVPIQARVSPELAALLDQLAEQNERTRNAELVISLKERLRRAGLLSPPTGTEEGQS